MPHFWPCNAGLWGRRNIFRSFCKTSAQVRQEASAYACVLGSFARWPEDQMALSRQRSCRAQQGAGSGLEECVHAFLGIGLQFVEPAFADLGQPIRIGQEHAAKRDQIKFTPVEAARKFVERF